MIVSAGSDGLPDATTVDNRGSRLTRIAISGRRWSNMLRIRRLLAIWAVLSLIWAGTVCYDLYHRASVQAEMARDVEHDLDQDQGLVTASCNGPDCGGTKETATQRLSDIVSTYLEFGSREFGVYTLGPPFALLVVGAITVFALRRRQRPELNAAD